MENVKTIQKVIAYLNNKETLTDSEFALLYMYSKMLLNVALTEETKNAN